MAFEFYSNFCKCATRKRKIRRRRRKTKKLSQFLKSHISGTREAISLKFGMWSAAVGGNVHSKNRLVSSRKHRATEVRKLRFLSSCQYTHGCYAPASWAARHTTVCLDNVTLILNDENKGQKPGSYFWLSELLVFLIINILVQLSGFDWPANY